MSKPLAQWLAPPHPTFRSHESKSLPYKFIDQTLDANPDALIVNMGSAWVRLHDKVLNLDLFLESEVDVQGDLLALPFADSTIDAVVCTGVLEHVADAYLAAQEIHRVMKPNGKVYIELPWMQGIHASPHDFQRWTPQGYVSLFDGFDIEYVRVAAGPASALAWMFQETLALLFSFNNETLYKIGLRVFGWLAVPISWLDFFLEKHPRAESIASGFALQLKKTASFQTQSKRLR
ncbi:MAG: class I SAM-dependent methyltransferase [Mariprofundaceae bacterium]|nr:class I SAM-dependent methyltransferase [Mariprofundaceae bacterium]